MISVLARQLGLLCVPRAIALFEIRLLIGQHIEGGFHPWSRMILRRRGTILIFESRIQRSEFHSSSCRLFVNEFGRLPCRFPDKLESFFGLAGSSVKLDKVTGHCFSLSEQASERSAVVVSR
jgi:hypothetical protein